MEFHPIANIFPMMGEDEFNALTADIQKHGQREPIWTHDGQIIDGRNRYLACFQLGKEPQYRTWDGAGSLVAFVLSLNLHRRHLTASQKAVIALDILPTLEQESKERQLSALKRGDALPVPQKFAERDNSEARERAAAMVGTNRQYVSDAKRIAIVAPDLIDEIRAGNIGITDAKRELKEREREEVRVLNRALIADAPPVPANPNQRYQTIVIDPPWDWGDEGDIDQFGRARPTYGTMSIDEIAALPVGDLADENAHIYLWITNRSLPKGFRLLEAWGFRYVTTLTWCKPSIGMGNYFRGSTEHVLFGVRGSLPLLRRDMGTHFTAPRNGTHSGKPADFYSIVESCSPGAWLEMFAREPRNGWVSWGAEVTQ